MLDNFGMGEFVTLAILALLFFGPEQLPRIGAQIGRWVSTMTGYSKAFMTEWRDEALVLQEAVAEVRGIRDELAAARAEITSTLDTARSDVDGALAGAKHDVQQQAKGIAQPPNRDPLPNAAPDSPPAAPMPPEEDERAAIAKTEAIVDDLLAERAATAEAPLDTLTPDAAPPPPRTVQPPTGRRTTAVESADLVRLRTQVSGLETEMSALRQELAQVRVRLHAVAPPADQVTDPAAAPERIPDTTAVPTGGAA
jgi:Sec-independent protein translocase protein TatA